MKNLNVELIVRGSASGGRGAASGQWPAVMPTSSWSLFGWRNRLRRVSWETPCYTCQLLEVDVQCLMKNPVQELNFVSKLQPENNKRISSKKTKKLIIPSLSVPGYLWGSMAAAYEKGDRLFCGLKLPEGLGSLNFKNHGCLLKRRTIKRAEEKFEKKKYCFNYSDYIGILQEKHVKVFFSYVNKCIYFERERDVIRYLSLIDP